MWACSVGDRSQSLHSESRRDCSLISWLSLIRSLLSRAFIVRRKPSLPGLKKRIGGSETARPVRSNLPLATPMMIRNHPRLIHSRLQSVTTMFRSRLQIRLTRTDKGKDRHSEPLPQFLEPPLTMDQLVHYLMMQPSRLSLRHGCPLNGKH